MSQAPEYGNSNTAYSMTQKATAFDQVQRAYFTGQMTDHDLTEVVTQPFWESMKLENDRHSRYGLIMDNKLTMKPDLTDDGEVSVRQDGHFYVGRCKVSVESDQTFFYQNKKIYHHKDMEKRMTSLLQTAGNGDTACCPNCGHEGKISSFIDGCDYCNAKFTVHDFTPKVSGFSSDENPEKKTSQTFWKVAMGLGITTGVFFVIAITALVFMMVGTVTQTSLKGTTNSIYFYMLASNMLPIMSSTLFWSVIIFGGIKVYLFNQKKPFMVHSDIVTKVIPNFSVWDFQQNLEYVLKNVHFTDQVSKIRPFLGCDLSAFVGSYQDVIDCCMTKLEFLDAGECATTYEIIMKVSMRVSRMHGKRIKSNREIIYLKMSGKKSLLEKELTAIREYKCPSCGGSVSLLSGGQCRFCGTQLDYENYGWIITDYATETEKVNTYQKISWSLVGVYLVILLLSCLSLKQSAKEFLGDVSMADVKEATTAADTFFDALVMPEEVCEEVERTSSEEGYANRKYEYNCDWGAKEAGIYAQYLRDQEGYQKISNGTDIFIMSKQVEIDGQKIYHHVQLTFSETTMTMYEELMDEE